MKRRTRIETIPKYESVRGSLDGNRFYKTPLGFMPSVTTVLRDDRKFDGWKKWAGEKKANTILQQASARGTWTHDASEVYLWTGNQPDFHFIYQPWFDSMKPFLDVIDHTLLTEGALWNSDQYAGACDCIAYLKLGSDFGGPNQLVPDADPFEPWLIDFKTANKPIGGSKLYGYELQVSSYIKAANFVYRAEGLLIRKGLIACAVPDYNVQIFTIDRDDITQLYSHFLEKLDDWHDKNTVPQNLSVNTDNNVPT